MLDIKMRFKKGILFIKARGNLTVDTSYILEESFNRVIDKSGSKYIYLNLIDIEIIDKMGIDIVKKCSKKVLNNNGKFIIKGLEGIFNSYIDTSSNLYQVSEEESVYGIVKLWLKN